MGSCPQRSGLVCTTEQNNLLMFLLKHKSDASAKREVWRAKHICEARASLPWPVSTASAPEWQVVLRGAPQLPNGSLNSLMKMGNLLRLICEWGRRKWKWRRAQHTETSTSDEMERKYQCVCPDSLWRSVVNRALHHWKQVQNTGQLCRGRRRCFSVFTTRKQHDLWLSLPTKKALNRLKLDSSRDQAWLATSRAFPIFVSLDNLVAESQQ